MEQAVAINYPGEDLSRYFNEIKNHELLTKDQAKNLAFRYQQDDDRDAGNRLVEAHLKLVVKIAKDYHDNTGRYSLSDLIQQGNLGLLHAIDKFDPDKNTKFSYYAVFWIRAFILKFMMDNYSSVKIGKTQAQRKLFFNLKKAKDTIRQSGLRVTAERIGQHLGVKPSEVEEMENRMGNMDLSLNEPSRTRNQEQLIENFSAMDETIESSLAKKEMFYMLRDMVAEIKMSLDYREREILEQRIIAREPLTLQALGKMFGVSRERIRQVEKSIIEKLRYHLQSRLPDFQTYIAG